MWVFDTFSGLTYKQLSWEAEEDGDLQCKEAEKRREREVWLYGEGTQR